MSFNIDLDNTPPIMVKSNYEPSVMISEDQRHIATQIQQLYYVFLRRTYSMEEIEFIKQTLTSSEHLSEMLKTNHIVWQHFQDYLTQLASRYQNEYFYQNSFNDANNKEIFFTHLKKLLFCYENIIIKFFNNETTFQTLFHNSISNIIDFKQMNVNDDVNTLKTYYIQIMIIVDEVGSDDMVKNILNEKLLEYVKDELIKQIHNFWEHDSIITFDNKLFSEITNWDNSFLLEKYEMTTYQMECKKLIHTIRAYKLIISKFVTNRFNARSRVLDVKDEMFKLRALLLNFNKNRFFSNLKKEIQQIQEDVNKVCECLEMVIQITKKTSEFQKDIANAHFQTIQEIELAQKTMIDRQSQINFEVNEITSVLSNINVDGMGREWLKLIKKLFENNFREIRMRLNCNMIGKRCMFTSFYSKTLFKPIDNNTRFLLVNEINFDFMEMGDDQRIRYFQCLKDLKTGYIYDISNCNIDYLRLQIEGDFFNYILNKKTLFFEQQVSHERTALERQFDTTMIIYEDLVNTKEIYDQVMWYNKQFMKLCYERKDKDRIHLRHIVYIENSCFVDQSQLILGLVFLNNNSGIISILWCNHIQPIDNTQSQTDMVMLETTIADTITNRDSLDYELHINRFTLNKYSSQGMARIITAIFMNIINITKICNQPVKRVISEAVNPISVWLLVYYFKWKLLPITTVKDIQYLAIQDNQIHPETLNFSDFFQNKWANQDINDTNKNLFREELDKQFKTPNFLRVFTESFVSEEDVKRAKQIEDAYFQNNRDMFCDLLKTGNEYYNLISFEEDSGGVSLDEVVFDNETLGLSDFKTNDTRLSETPGGRRRKRKSRKRHKLAMKKTKKHKFTRRLQPIKLKTNHTVK